jgi:hypothetical protein
MKKIRLLFISIIYVLNTFSQETVVLKDTGSWFTLSNSVIVSDNFYFANVFQQRRVDFLNKTQAFLVAPSINYKVSKNLTFGAGYLFYKYYPNGVSHSEIKKDEHRFFQNLILNTNTGRFKLNNRLRFEQRAIESIENKEIIGRKKVNRLRYRFQVTTNLFKLNKNKHLLGKLSNELRIRFATGLSNPDFDQNNFAALLGYKLVPNSSIWLGYGRYYFKKNSATFISNDILHLNISYNFDIRKQS